MNHYFLGLTHGFSATCFFWAFFNAKRFAKHRYEWEKEKGIFGTKESWFSREPSEQTGKREG